MSSGLESIAADQWLYETLSGSTALGDEVAGVFHDLAPEGTGDPIVIFAQYDDGNVERALGSGGEMYTVFTYLVKVVGLHDRPEDLRDAYTIVHGLIENKKCQTVDTGTIQTCQRVGVHRLVIGETSPGVGRTASHREAHLGGFYRIVVQA